MSNAKYVPPHMKNQENRFSALGDSDASPKSYVSKFNNTASKLPKPTQSKAISLDSEADFPSLGGVAKKTTTVTTSKFSDMAKNWAQKAEEESVKARLERERIAREKEDFENIRRNMKIVKNLGKVTKRDDDEDELEYDYRESILGEEEDYHVPSEEELEQSEEDEDEYYNPDELEEYQKY